MGLISNASLADRKASQGTHGNNYSSKSSTSV
jgi:hypothetical protein